MYQSKLLGKANLSIASVYGTRGRLKIISRSTSSLPRGYPLHLAMVKIN